ncbi:MAG: adenylate kinase family protein [Limisphaerales bacterium]
MKKNNESSSIAIPVANRRVSNRAVWLKAGNSKCTILPPPSTEARRLVLLGAPGVGKGTQAELLSQWCGACHLSTGDIFRAANSLPLAERPASIRDALDYMERGALVPDQMVLALIWERLRCLHCTGGFLLDGFPRTLSQAEAFERLLRVEELPLTAAINYELPLDKIIERMAGRRVCSGCKGVFNIADKLTSPESCPNCGAKLYQREDDRPEVVRIRMEAYHRSTKPLIEFYLQRGLLLTISAEGTAPEILQRTVDAIFLSAKPPKETANPTPGH